MIHQKQFEREAQWLDEDLENGIITNEEHRRYMRELIEDFGYEEESDL